MSSTTVEVPSTGAAKNEADWDALGIELVEIARIDQEERADFGDPDVEPFNDEHWNERLIEIVDRYGWPTPDLAGAEANRAAFLIAQHSVSDPAFQKRVLSRIQRRGHTTDGASRKHCSAIESQRTPVNRNCSAPGQLR